MQIRIALIKLDLESSRFGRIFFVVVGKYNDIPMILRPNIIYAVGDRRIYRAMEGYGLKNVIYLPEILSTKEKYRKILKSALGIKKLLSIIIYRNTLPEIFIRSEDCYGQLKEVSETALSVSSMMTGEEALRFVIHSEKDNFLVVYNSEYDNNLVQVVVEGEGDFVAYKSWEDFFINLVIFLKIYCRNLFARMDIFH